MVVTLRSMLKSCARTTLFWYKSLQFPTEFRKAPSNWLRCDPVVHIAMRGATQFSCYLKGGPSIKVTNQVHGDRPTSSSGDFWQQNHSLCCPEHRTCTGTVVMAYFDTYHKFPLPNNSLHALLPSHPMHCEDRVTCQK